MLDWPQLRKQLKLIVRQNNRKRQRGRSRLAVSHPQATDRLDAFRQGFESLERRVLLSGSTGSEAAVLEPDDDQPVQVVIDNRDDSGFLTTGNWRESGAADEFSGSSFYSNENGATATWSADLPEDGLYEAQVWVAGQTNWGSYDRDSTAEYEVTYAGGSATVYVDQDAAPGQWTTLDQFYFDADETASITLTGNGNSLGDRNGTSADAVRFVKVDTPDIVISNTQVQVVEGGSAQFAVQLSSAPTEPVVIAILPTAGSDPDLQADAVALSFDSSNWDQPQLVTINNIADNDAVLGVATFSVSGPNMAVQTVTAYEYNAEVSRVQSLTYRDFHKLSADEVAYLTTDQIASIPNSWWFRRINAEGREKLGTDQIQAIDLSNVHIRFLSDSQREQLSVGQVHSLSYNDFNYLTPKQVSQLSISQIESIQHSWHFRRISEAGHNTMTTEQVQAINLSAIGLRFLTDYQRSQLSLEQIQSLSFTDYQYLSPDQVPSLTTQQVSEIPNSWWFRRMSDEARASLTTEQIQAINLNIIGLRYLSDSQRAQISSEQIHNLTFHNFHYLTGDQVAQLTTEQIKSIPNSWWFRRIDEQARESMTESQVHALNISIVTINNLSDTQRAMLSTEQIQSLSHHYFGYLSPSQAVQLSTTQLSSIPNDWTFRRLSEEARAALTQEQIQALNVSVINLKHLTDQQVDWLTVGQIQSLRAYDFGYLDTSQVVHLTGKQLASIDSSWLFRRMDENVRAALLPEQIQAIDTSAVSLRYFTPLQRALITIPQIQQIQPGDFRYLNHMQVPYITRVQMTRVTSAWQISSMDDQAENALTRQQLLALPGQIYAHLTNSGHSDEPAPMSSAMQLAMATMNMDDGHMDHGDGGMDHDHDMGGDHPHVHPDDPDKRMEHLAVFDLVKHENATHMTIASGNWSDASTWMHGMIPDADANVIVSADHTVIFDEIITQDALNTVRVDGILEFATNEETQLLVDTIVVDTEGLLRIGSEDNPMQDGYTARIIIADGDEIDPTIDPLQLGKGLISHGQVEMNGQDVTPYAALQVDPLRGDTQLILEDAPTNWKVGDQLILTGTSMWQEQDEEREIVAIDGNVVTLDRALDHNHRTPEGYDLSVYVANVSRNIVIMSERPDVNALRGHVMFMHNQNVQVHNVGFYGMGRSDKRNPSNDAQFDHDGNLIENTGLNQRGRYSVHFHRAGDSASNSPGVVTGSAVVDSPGWGFVNHESFVVMEDNVAFNVVGASFVTENGNEIGAFRRNLSIRTTGSGDGLEEREDIFDFGHNGHGFWMQGPGVEVEGNISVGDNDASFIFFTRSSMAEFDVTNLDDPSIAEGRETLPVGSVPIKLFKGNTSFASKTGLETWFHLLRMNDVESHFQDFTAWNMQRSGSHNPYTNNAVFTDFLLIGNTDNPRGTGFSRNNVSRSFTYDNVEVVGFKVGIDVPVNGSTVIQDGTFQNIQSIRISGSHDVMRTVDINGDVNFVDLDEDALRGRTQYKIFMNSEIDTENTELHTLFSPDIVRLGLITLNGKQLYYHKQAADYTMFAAENAPDFIPPELIGKTNQQLWDEYGIAPAGAIAPPDSIEIEGINGLVGDPTEYLPEVHMTSQRFTNQLNGYTLRYIDEFGQPTTDNTPVNLREGWNLITREVNGNKRTFFVFGDTTAPQFVPSSSHPLVVNPAGLQFGFTVHGTMIDAGVKHGMKKVRIKFNTLEGMPILTRPDGTSYILLQFEIKDRAGNRTSVSLELTLDPNAPVVPGTAQKDLPEIPVSWTMSQLLNDYLLT